MHRRCGAGLDKAEDFDETEDAKEDYSAGTTRLLDRIEEQWFL